MAGLKSFVKGGVKLALGFDPCQETDNSIAEAEERRLQQFHAQFYTSTLSDAPGRKIIKSLGLVQHSICGVRYDDSEDVDSAISALRIKAVQAGGNAVINIKLQTGSHAGEFSPTYMIAYGEAVLLEEAA